MKTEVPLRRYLGDLPLGGWASLSGFFSCLRPHIVKAERLRLGPHFVARVAVRSFRGPQFYSPEDKLHSSAMVEFKKVVIPDEIDALCGFDRRAFHSYPADIYSPEHWRDLESYWMVVEGKTVGCSALEPHVDYDGRPRRGTLYISSTGVLPEFQGQGFGSRQKEWQIEYAKEHGFARIVTNMRESNKKIIRLNEKFGFKTLKTHPQYYHDPDEAAIVMELELEGSPGLCPRCGKLLRTSRAKQCRFCGADWH